MKRSERLSFSIDFFQRVLPDPQTELHFGNTYELLVAVILSAQCTDKRINTVTPALFQRFPDVASLSRATYDEVFALIRSVSFPGNKSRHLLGMAELVMTRFGGQIPMTVEELVLLPGVGRKTANVITSVIDGQPNMAVDTHVFRVSARIGLTHRAKNPLETERQLTAIVPRDLIARFHHWLILHGRYTCTARSPKCPECGLRPVCKYYLSLQRAEKA